jgi:hypothetical protein
MFASTIPSIHNQTLLLSGMQSFALLHCLNGPITSANITMAKNNETIAQLAQSCDCV